jgi:hypothetical protein
MNDNSKTVKIVRGLLLLGAMVMIGCETAHNVAVSSFHVLDAPANYVRKHIDKPTPTPGPIASDSVKPGRTVNSTPPPRQPTQSVASQPQSQPRPSVTPRPSRTVNTESSNPLPTPASHVANTSSGQFPTAKPVPGKPGYVYSPFDTNGGYVDVNGFPPGSKVKDPYSGKVFLVP